MTTLIVSKTEEEVGEICQKCGKPVACVWSAPTKLWEDVTGFGRGGILCCRCFDALVWKRTDAFLYWSCDTRGYPGLRFTRGRVVSIGLGILLQRVRLWLRQCLRRQDGYSDDIDSVED